MYSVIRSDEQKRSPSGTVTFEGEPHGGAHVGNRAQRENAGQVDTGKGWPDGGSPGRQDKRVVRLAVETT